MTTSRTRAALVGGAAVLLLGIGAPVLANTGHGSGITPLCQTGLDHATLHASPPGGIAQGQVFGGPCDLPPGPPT